jgi:hypothetical protein
VSRSRGLALGIVLTLLSRPALAEEVPQPQVLVGRAMSHRIDGCSRARSTLTVSASFSITLHPDGLAQLRVEHTSDNHTMHMGQIGDGPISSAITLDHAHDVFNLEGRVQREAHAFMVHFQQSTEQHARWTGYGTLPLGAPISRAVDLELRCQERQTLVESADHTSTTESFFACMFTPSLLSSPFGGIDEFPLSARAIVRDRYTHFPGHEEGTTYAWAPLPTP